MRRSVTSVGSDSVFVYEDGQIRAMPSRNFRDPVLTDLVKGANLEAALQSLLEQYPELLPGDQIDPGADPPPRFILLRREAAVGGGSVDLLLVDDAGVLTLVETKLVENPEARRAVIGQILEYAANAADDLRNGAARREAEAYWSERPEKLDDLIHGVLGREDVDAFWAEVGENLQDGRFRLIIAADKLRPEVRRIIEYLNREARNVRIYGLEICCYAQDAGRVVIAPRLIGQTQSTADDKETATRRVRWTPDRLRDEYANLLRSNPLLGAWLQKVLAWAVRQGVFADTLTHPTRPAFLLSGPSGEYVVSFYADGAICCRFGQAAAGRFPGGVDGRNRFVAALKQLNLVDARVDPDTMVSGRQLSRRLFELTDDELDNLLDVFEKFLKPA